MLKQALSKYVLGVAGLVAGLGVGLVGLANAQTPTTTATTPVTTTTTAPGTASVATEATEPKTHGHAPLGGDGVVSSISGSTVVVGEESDEGGAAYSVDASKATVTKNGVAGSLSDITVGEKIFVQGTVTGTNVVATSISVGHPGERGGKAESANDSDGGAANEAGEASSPSTSNQ